MNPVVVETRGGASSRDHRPSGSRVLAMARTFAMAMAVATALGSGVLAVGLTGGGFGLGGQAAAGGGTSIGGGYGLSGWISAQGGGVSAGGTYRLAGGLFPVQVAPGSALPIKVAFTADKLAELRWPEGFEGYVLEFSPAVGPDADWQPTVPQPVSNVFVTPCQQPARFFRLRRP